MENSKEFLRKDHVRNEMSSITPTKLGSASFREDYGIKYAYLAGAMYKGIASKEMVVAMGECGLFGSLGTGGMPLEEIELSIQFIQSKLGQSASFGMNLLAGDSEMEEQLVDLYLKYGVRKIEAAAYIKITPEIVRYRLNGLRQSLNGEIETLNRVIAKVSRPEVAEAFLRPASSDIVSKLLQDGRITASEARLSQNIPVSQDICIEADSGGHTDQGVAFAIVPAIRSLRDRIMAEEKYLFPLRIGVAGGIGTPDAAAAAFALGADFILTGSINQCTVEARTSDAVKDILQGINVQDTDYAPAGDMFELGAKVQVLRKGVFFPARANKLYQLYLRYNSIEEIDEHTRAQIQEKYFHKSFEEVWAETLAYHKKDSTETDHLQDLSSKQKMALIFRWYFVHSTRLALDGSSLHKVDYQVHTGPALGAFNQLVRGTKLEGWRNRHVTEIAELLMCGAARCLNDRFTLSSNG